MIYESVHSKVIELLQVDHKILAVSYEFAPRNNSRKWVVERDWRDIEAVVGDYIDQKRYLNRGHKESFDVAGDIQLEVTNKTCPSYLSKLFEVPSDCFCNLIICVFVNHGRLQEQQDARTQANGDTDEIPLTISSVDSDEEKYVPKSRSAKPTGATYTPSKNIQTTGFEEYVPDGIPPEAANQYKATKRKRRERPVTPDIIPESSESPVTPVRKSTRGKREVYLLSTTQVPSCRTPRSSSPSKKSIPLVVLPRLEKAKDLFGSDNTESDIELQETPGEEEIPEKTPEERRKKRVVLSEWVTKTPQEGKREMPRNLQIMSPTRMKNKQKKEKKRHKEKKKESTKTKSPVIKKNCRHISVRSFLSSFNLVEEETNEAISQFVKDQQIPKIKEFHYTRYVDLITKAQVDAAMEFLIKRHKSLCDDDYGRMTTMFSEYIIPEWTINLFMHEHKMNREEAIKYFIENENKAGLSW